MNNQHVFSPDEEEHIGRQTAMIYQQIGIEGCLGYLFPIVSKMFSANRIHICVVDHEVKLLWSLGTVSDSTDIVPGYVVPFEKIPQIVGYDMTQMGKVTIQYDNDFCIPESYGNTYIGVVKEFHAAACVLILAREHQSVCFVGLCQEKNSFSREGLESLQRILVPLGDALGDSLFEQMYRQIPEGKSRTFKQMQLCPDLAELMRVLPVISALDNTILITGETGAGKGVTAEVIHDLSKRSTRPFVAVNCGALPESLADSLLFGHERGAFTGATGTHRGYFEQAQGGTIFLDEIGELPLMLQVKLLRVLDKHVVKRIGGTMEIPLNIRVIAATNRDLEEMIERGAFREDLFYRLNVFDLQIPPLRKRPNDLPVLTQFFLKEKCRRLGIKPVPVIIGSDMDRLKSFSWPGNIRQLENVIEKALLLLLARGGGRKLTFGTLLNEKSGGRRRHSETRHIKYSREYMPEPADDLAGQAFDIEISPGGEPKVAPIEDAIDSYIKKVVRLTGGRISGPTGAAALLGMHKTTLYRRLKRMKLAIHIEDHEDDS
ncbi:MAG: sigma-54-dependent Fis family transcriptional regulator [Mailhella sp.]|nr:sigma-54-dependent Fis family transcriptional regulator [Mailhella sp.]